ncbi:MAG: hypothetical protein AAGD05_12095 [Bacteroidota bacterium]
MITFIPIIILLIVLFFVLQFIRLCIRQIFGHTVEATKMHLNFYGTILYFRFLTFMAFGLLLVVAFSVVAVPLSQKAFTATPSTYTKSNQDKAEADFMEIIYLDGSTESRKVKRIRNRLIEMDGIQYKLLEKQKLKTNGAFKRTILNNIEYCLVRKK